MQTLFEKSVSSSDNLADGSHSPNTDGVNLLQQPGVAYQPATITDKSTNLTGNLIAYTPGVAGTQGNGFFLDDQGYVYSVDTSWNLTKSSQLAGTYQAVGVSDMVQIFNISGTPIILLTSTTDVALIKSDLSGGNAVFWSSTLGKGTLTGGVWHPLVVFQDILWIGDGANLHNITSASAGNANVLSLSGNRLITALGTEPTNGQMLIGATVNGTNNSTIAAKNSIFTYDGTSATYTREYPVDGIITGFKTVGGVTYVFYGGNKVGYWTGSGVKFLRTLKNAIFSVGADIPWKQHVAAINETLYIIDGAQILAFGVTASGGRPVWRYCYFNYQTGNHHLNLLCNVGDGLLGIGVIISSAAKFETFDPVAISNLGNMTFVTNKYAFERPTFIREIYLEYADGVLSGDALRTLSIKTEKQLSGFNAINDVTNSNALNNSDPNTVYNQLLEVKGILADKVLFFQLQYFTSGSVTGLRRIIVYIDEAE